MYSFSDFYFIGELCALCGISLYYEQIIREIKQLRLGSNVKLHNQWSVGVKFFLFNKTNTDKNQIELKKNLNM